MKEKVLRSKIKQLGLVGVMGGIIGLMTCPYLFAANAASSSMHPEPFEKIRLQDEIEKLAPDQALEKVDSSGQGAEPDIFSVYEKDPDGRKVLVTQAFDLNHDGKIDLVKHFVKGKLVRTEADTDYDGIVDVISIYDPATGEISRKIQADGKTTIWKYYSKSQSSMNELRRKEVDRNGDGKPDMWVYYRHNKVIRTEVDEDFKGKIIRINGPLQPKVSVSENDSNVKSEQPKANKSGH